MFKLVRSFHITFAGCFGGRRPEGVLTGQGHNLPRRGGISGKKEGRNCSERKIKAIVSSSLVKDAERFHPH